VQARHRGVLVAEAVLGPDGALARAAVHGVDEAVAAGHGARGPRDVGGGQEAGWHAGPQREDGEGEEVAGGHCAAAGGVEGGIGAGGAGAGTGAAGGGGGGGGGKGLREGEGAVRVGAGWGGGGVVVEPDEEEDGPRNVDEGVDAVGPV